MAVKINGQTFPDGAPVNFHGRSLNIVGSVVGGSGNSVTNITTHKEERSHDEAIDPELENTAKDLQILALDITYSIRHMSGKEQTTQSMSELAQKGIDLGRLSVQNNLQVDHSLIGKGYGADNLERVAHMYSNIAQLDMEKGKVCGFEIVTPPVMRGDQVIHPGRLRVAPSTAADNRR